MATVNQPLILLTQTVAALTEKLTKCGAGRRIYSTNNGEESDKENTPPRRNGRARK